MKKRRVYFSILVLGFFIFLLSSWHYRFFPFQKLYLRVPLQFIGSSVPLTEIEVEGTNYLVNIDLGNNWELSLHPDILSKIEKQYLRTEKWHDIKGNEYESAIYLIPKICLGSATIHQLKVGEDSDKFNQSGSVIETGEDPDADLKGSLGRALFLPVNILFDFKASNLYVIKKSASLKSLQKAGFDLHKFSELPIEVKPWGILTTVETDFGPLKLVLDTGATTIFVQPSSLKNFKSQTNRMTTSKFVLGNKDYGEQKLYLFQFTERFKHMDGLLGMDFFENKILYLDLQNNKALIGH